MMSFSHLARRHSAVILFIGIIVAVCSTALSFALPMEYRADAQLLVIAPTPAGGDTYAALKSAERVGDSLANIVKTNDFFQKVISPPSSFALDTSAYQNVTERVKRKRWQKAIEASVGYGTSVVTVSTYHKNPSQAEAYAGAAVDVLSREASGYVGSSVTVKVMNAPVVTRFPARPNFLLNGAVGLMLGLILGVLYAYKQEKKKEM